MDEGGTDGVDEELEDVVTVLWECARLVYALYDEYALLGASGIDDVYAVSFGAFMQLIADAELDLPSSSTCRKCDLDGLMIETDTSARRSEIDDEYGLSRPEFLQVIVGVAVRRHVATGETPDVSDAVGMLLRDVIAPAMPPHVLDDAEETSREMRRSVCYTEAVTRRLEPLVPMCKQLFLFYSGLRQRDSRKERKLLAIEEFAAMMADTLPGLEQARYCSERDLQRCFLRSRMRVIDVVWGKRARMARNLGFEDFMEVRARDLCRSLGDVSGSLYTAAHSLLIHPTSPTCPASGSRACCAHLAHADACRPRGSASGAPTLSRRVV